MARSSRWGPRLEAIALARYNPNGSLDTSFSGDGRQITDFESFAEANAAALQPDGKIVVAGSGFGGSSQDFMLARYNPNGSLDTSFSGDGKQTTDFGTPEVSVADDAHAVAIESGGKIVVAGSTGTLTATNFALARYNPNGSLDTSFSGDGKQITGFGAGTNDRANGVALQADGKIVAAGSTSSFGGSDFALARYNPNGSLDTTFSGDGKQTTDFGDVDGANAVAVQGNNRIVAAGGGGGGDDFALARYNPNGSLDTSFSGDGKQTTDFGGFNEANGVALQSDAKIVAVGRGGANDDFALARYNPNGSLDTTFSGDGKQTTDFGGFDEANAVAIQGDGKIVAVGSTDFSDFALARYNANGSLDTTFSGDGKQTTSFPGFDQAKGLAIQGDGKIIAVGGTGDDDPSGAVDFALARYNPNGSLDTTFSGDGRQTTDFGQFEEASGVALQGDGKVVVVGRTAAAATSPSPTSRSPVTTPTARSTRASRATASRPRPSDRTAATTSTPRLPWRSRATARSSWRGTASTAPSTTSPSPAITPTARSTPPSQATASRRAPSRAGRPAWRSRATARSSWLALDDSDFVLARYNSNGLPDTSFSGDGEQTTDFGGADGANGVGLQASGKIVAVGFTRQRLRARPLQPERLARHHLLGRRQADHRLRGLRSRERGGAQEHRQDHRGRRRWGQRRLRDRPLQPGGLARHELLGDGKQTTDFGAGGSTRTPSRSKATGTSSRQETPSAPTEPGTSRSLATRGVEATFSAWRPA